LLILLFSCKKTESNKSQKPEISKLIEDKTYLKLSDDFTILLDSIAHTEEAFDTDYKYYLILEYHPLTEKNIVEQITTSLLFDTIQSSNYADPIWGVIHSKTEKGIWASRENGFNFFHSDTKLNKAEPFYLTVDTLNNRIELDLTHL
jgi:hypothetical protein